MNHKSSKLPAVMAFGIALLLAAVVAVVVASRNRHQPAPPPEAPVAQAPAEVRVKAVERKTEPVEQHIWTLFASHAHLRVIHAHLRADPISTLI